MIQPTDYEYATAKPSDAEIVRRFLAKAYGEEHPAMVALKSLEGDRSFRDKLVRDSYERNHPANASLLPRKTTAAPNTLHGDFGAMEFSGRKTGQ